MKRTILNLQWSTVLGVFLSVCTACGHKTGNGTGTTDSIPMAAAPEFNADSAFAYTAAQCAFGPRVPNTEAHRLCGTYIAEKFKSFGATVTDQYADVKAYDGTVLKARNIIASYNPDAKARILVCGPGLCQLAQTGVGCQRCSQRCGRHVGNGAAHPTSSR